MGYIRDEIIQAAQTVNATIVELKDRKKNDIRKLIISRYTKDYDTHYIWKGLKEDYSIQDPEGWRLIHEFIKDLESILFFDEDEETSMFLFEDGAKIVQVLSESVGFEFYITNKAADFLICFNHHDFLIVAGTAVNWLQERSFKHR